MEHLTCLICQEHVRVPVRLTCFDCQPRDGRKCNDVVRACLYCARSFLRLTNLSPPRFVKCLTCEVTVSPRTLTTTSYESLASRAYEVDHVLMAIDGRRDYLCFHSDEDCDFVGTHVDLYRHVLQCPRRKIRCGRCQEVYRLGDASRHLCPRESLSCRFCAESVLRKDTTHHLTAHLETARIAVECAQEHVARVEEEMRQQDRLPSRASVST